MIDLLYSCSGRFNDLSLLVPCEISLQLFHHLLTSNCKNLTINAQVTSSTSAAIVHDDQVLKKRCCQTTELKVNVVDKFINVAMSLVVCNLLRSGYFAHLQFLSMSIDWQASFSQQVVDIHGGCPNLMKLDLRYKGGAQQLPYVITHQFPQSWKNL